MKTIRERIISKVLVDDAGCWVFQGAKNSKGYGSVRVDGASLSTHRVMYELDKGPIPDDMDVDHLCRVRACCNPEHLEAITRQIHATRSLAAQKDHCKKGHPLAGDNLRVVTRGTRTSRVCIKCARAANREFMRRSREAEAA
ncbi:HNH endonuclease signature motif containing protein [Arthrobacter pityocampae]|uniref:HNH endonuclease signature motif containing protein n=1 Tax=Arthrobacter pityocampae TaxID=547334 RepID=UPI003736847E